MKNEIKYAVFNKTESLAGSVLKDLTTLAVVSLLVYVSQGSKWWTLVTGLMFIFWVIAKITVITKQRYKTFKTKSELQEWVDALKD
jgi:membrane protein YdbS with pleckstrin-like domain